MRTKIHVGIAVLTLLGLLIYHLGFNTAGSKFGGGLFAKKGDSVPEINWEMLYSLDYKTMEGAAELMALDGKYVKIPGYIVPLSDNYSELDEFILVPDGQSCIHVPPPPPNLIVAVSLREKVPGSEVHNPSWVYGMFKIEYSTHQYGGAAFKLDGMKMEKFEFDDYEE